VVSLAIEINLCDCLWFLYEKICGKACTCNKFYITLSGSYI
jgi:hypothetical protein